MWTAKGYANMWTAKGFANLVVGYSSSERISSGADVPAGAETSWDLKISGRDVMRCLTASTRRKNHSHKLLFKLA